MKRWVIVAVAMLGVFAVTGSAEARGPYGSINVGNWKGGAFTNDQTGAFSTSPAMREGFTLLISCKAKQTESAKK